MGARWADYSYIVATIVFTVYGQLILKWRMNSAGPLPAEFTDKLRFLGALLLDPAVLSSFIAAFLAALAWMAALTRFDLNHAYPFMSLNFVVVLLLSTWLLSEPLSATRVIGVTLIVIGTVVAGRG